MNLRFSNNIDVICSTEYSINFKDSFFCLCLYLKKKHVWVVESPQF